MKQHKLALQTTAVNEEKGGSTAADADVFLTTPPEGGLNVIIFTNRIAGGHGAQCCLGSFAYCSSPVLLWL